ncbi:MAG: ABC transporter permease [Burkholderiales bacterium]|nr:ABC transporter permease [Burkholderiales bacterium]
MDDLFISEFSATKALKRPLFTAQKSPIVEKLRVWAYRGFISGSVKREFQAKYRHSLLGAVWTVLNPLALIVVYTVIFSQVMRTRLPGAESSFAYSIYLCAGILTWGLFSEITLRAQTVFLDNANLLKKVSFPRFCLPIIVILNASVNFAIIFALFTLFLLISGNFPGWLYFAIFPLLLLQIMFSIGIGMILGVVNVFFRDVGQFFGILIQFWFWFTPIVYSPTILPEEVRGFIAYNPMAALIGAYQRILVNQQAPDWLALLPLTLGAIALCLLGLQLFRKRVGEIVDEL